MTCTANSPASVLSKIFETWLRGRFDREINIPEATLEAARNAYTLCEDQNERRAAWHGYNHKGIVLGEMPPARRGSFGFDGSPGLMTGYTLGDNWNGWARPLVTEEVAKRLVPKLAEMLKTSGTTYRWDDKPGIVQIDDDDDGQPHESPMVEMISVVTEDGRLQLFDISLGLCWVEDELDWRAPIEAAIAAAGLTGSLLRPQRGLVQLGMASGPVHGSTQHGRRRRLSRRR